MLFINNYLLPLSFYLHSSDTGTSPPLGTRSLCTSYYLDFDFKARITHQPRRRHPQLFHPLTKPRVPSAPCTCAGSAHRPKDAVPPAHGWPLTPHLVPHFPLPRWLCSPQPSAGTHSPGQCHRFITGIQGWKCICSSSVPSHSQLCSFCKELATSEAGIVPRLPAPQGSSVSCPGLWSSKDCVN